MAKNIPNISVEKDRTREIKCEKCSLTFSGKKAYTIHSVKEHGEIKLMTTEIECKSCEMKFHTPNFYIQHHQNIHGNLPPDYSEKKLFFCDQCPQVYITKQSLTDHVSYKHRDKQKTEKILTNLSEILFIFCLQTKY